jgi:hypothetical protein
MTTTREPHLPQNHITQEQLDAIAGGGCTAEELQSIAHNLIQTYEDLSDFTSYMIERVVGP